MPRVKKSYTHNGVTKTIAEWSRISGIEYNTLNMRIKLNVSPDIIFDKKIPKREYHLKPRTRKITNSKHDTMWTKSAIDCYDIGCRCSKCNNVPEYFKSQCRMKYTVLQLVRLYGEPERGTEQ